MGRNCWSFKGFTREKRPACTWFSTRSSFGRATAIQFTASASGAAWTIIAIQPTVATSGAAFTVTMMAKVGVLYDASS